MLELPQLEIIDGCKIGQYLRDQMQMLHRGKKISELVAETTKEYMERIDLERNAKENHVESLRNVIRSSEKKFAAFSLQMETELDECVSRLRALERVRSEDARAAWIASEEGVRAWRAELEQLRMDRKEKANELKIQERAALEEEISDLRTDRKEKAHELKIQERAGLEETSEIIKFFRKTLQNLDDASEHLAKNEA
eukprot:927378_1